MSRRVFICNVVLRVRSPVVIKGEKSGGRRLNRGLPTKPPDELKWAAVVRGLGPYVDLRPLTSGEQRNTKR